MTSNVIGLQKLQAMLASMPDKIKNDLLPRALAAGGDVLAEEIKASVPVGTGLLRDGIRVLIDIRKNAVTAIVAATGKHGYIANFLEWGTAAHIIRAKDGAVLAFGGHAYRQVDHPGIAPKPIFRPALDARGDAAMAAVAAELRRGMK